MSVMRQIRFILNFEPCNFTYKYMSTIHVVIYMFVGLLYVAGILKEFVSENTVCLHVSELYAYSYMMRI